MELPRPPQATDDSGQMALLGEIKNLGKITAFPNFPIFTFSWPEIPGQAGKRRSSAPG